MKMQRIRRDFKNSFARNVEKIMVYGDVGYLLRGVLQIGGLWENVYREDHQGKSCQNGRICGLDGCTDMHHCLLHKQNTVESRSPVTDHAEIRHLENNDFSKNSRAEQENVSTNRATFFTEGNDTAHGAAMVAQSRTKPHFIGLRTVPVILLNKDRSLRVNALLDDASTKIYVNANIAKELGLQGRTKKVNVSVLNGHVETLITKSIDFTLQNVTGNVSMKLNAYTVNKVTGDMPVVDWNHYKEQWPHPRNIDFPSSSKRPLVDILIGLDYADLLYAIEERRGKPGDPIARLTPLGWTCIGNLDSHDNTILQTKFA